MKHLLTLAILLFTFSAQAAVIGPAFGTFSSAGGSVSAAKQNINTMQVTGATFSKPSGKPTMTIPTAASELTAATEGAPSDSGFFGFLDTTFKKISWANVKAQIKAAILVTIDDRDYATLALADTAAVSAGKQLVVSSVWATVPTTLSASIKILPGGKLDDSGSVAISGPFEGSDGCFGASQAVTGLKDVEVSWFGVEGDGTDESAGVQRALDTGAAIVRFSLPETYYYFGDIEVTTRGQRLIGAGFNKCAVVPKGTNLFKVQENSIEITGFWFRPAVLDVAVQDTTNTTNIIYTEHLTDVTKNIDGLRVHDNYFQNIAGAAIYMKSGLRESYIYKNQFRGMGSVANGTGVIHGDLPANFYDNSNYVWATENVFYRAETPFIYLKAVAGSNPAKPYYDHWNVEDNLFHGQLLDENVAVADPTGPVVGGDTHMIQMQSFSDMVVERNSFSSFNGAYSGVFTEVLATDDKNGPLYARNNRFAVDNNGVYTGNAVKAADCFSNIITGNSFKSGIQAVDVLVTNSGTFSYTPVVDINSNTSTNQNPVTYTVPAHTAPSITASTVTATATTTGSVTVTDKLNYLRGGRVTLTSSSVQQQLTFAALGLSNMPDGNYDVYLRVVDQNLATWVTGTTVGGFYINLASNPGSRTVSWFVVDTSP